LAKSEFGKKLLLGSKLEIIGYKASRRLPIIMSIPTPMPRIVGQLVPDSGRVGAVGVGVGTGVAVWLGVGVGVAVPQTQSVSDGHEAFLQKPLLQKSPLPQL
jgi:hypothetical protein